MTAPAFDLVNGFLALRDQLSGGQGGSLGAPPIPRVGRIPYGGSLPARFAALQQSGGGNFDEWVNTIAKLKGLTPAERDAFYQLGMGESGGRNIPQGIVDINTKKGTPAFGPWQVIEPTFRSYMEPGYEDWQNPIHSGLASINYQRSRYGRILSRPGY